MLVECHHWADRLHVGGDLCAFGRRLGGFRLGCLSRGVQWLRPALSPRETEVLIEWFQPESKEFVAHRLGISPSTVNSHLERIRIKYAQIGREASNQGRTRRPRDPRRLDRRRRSLIPLIENDESPVVHTISGAVNGLIDPHSPGDVSDTFRHRRC